MENILAEWMKDVKVQMIRRDIGLDDLSAAVGKSRSHTSAVIHGNVIAPDTARAVSEILGVEAPPCSEVKEAIAGWGKLVKIALVERDWKTKDLAKELGKSRDYTGGLMNGYHINKAAARAICEILGVPDAPYSNW